MGHEDTPKVVVEEAVEHASGPPDEDILSRAFPTALPTDKPNTTRAQSTHTVTYSSARLREELDDHSAFGETQPSLNYDEEGHQRT
jgi:hypothetical protein